MSDTAGAAGTANMHDNGDERYVKPSVNAPVVITSYRALLACNGSSLSLIHSPAPSGVIAEKFRQL
jgi:hypothetical protein